MTKSTLFIAFLALSMLAHADPVYRWVDEHGKTHFSDRVPKQYKHAAQRIDSRIQEGRSAHQPRHPALPPVAPAAVIDPRLAEPQPYADTAAEKAMEAASSPAKGDDCALLRQRYWDSQACFAKYKNVNGSTKAEAFKHCTEVLDPTPQCGPIVTE